MHSTSEAALARRRDKIAGAMIAAIGSGAALEGRSYHIGTLLEMGPGFMPTVLGLGMVAVGLLMALMVDPLTQPDGLHGPIPPLDVRGAACIFGGVAAFLVFGSLTGFVPASFACIFISAMGDRSATSLSAALLAAGVTAAGVVLFGWVLNVPFPLIWGGL